MREIKFRAWDKKTSAWLLGYEYPSLGGFSMFGEVMMLGEYASLLSARMRDLENIVLMQFTGLKDKNGKSIYEGDVVRNYHERGEVISHLGSFGCFFNPQDFTSLETIWERGDGHKLEIIGNIYENPELLKNE